MFKKTKRKIVIAIQISLLVLLVGTFCMIYVASYVRMTTENRQLLETYADWYRVFDEDEKKPEKPEQGIKEEPEQGTGTEMEEAEESESKKDSKEEKPEEHREDPSHRKKRRKFHKLELSTFYSVAISDDGQVLKVDIADMRTMREDSLVEVAKSILESGIKKGVRHNLIYQVEDKGDYTLVAFLDNTIMMTGAGTLVMYTLAFISLILLLLFFVSGILASRIVAPLEENDKRQKQFISDAGHELKTPVAAASANVEMLAREIGENPWLSNIQYENERMAALITQLLDLARTEHTSPQMESLNLSQLVEGEVLAMEAVAYEKGVQLEAEIAEDIRVCGNALYLKQITAILLDNALGHGQEGQPVHIALKKDRKNVRLSVVNYGEEISEEQRKHLFDRFYQTDASRSRKGHHYGLGLAIAKSIVEIHKGTITADCHDGKIEFLVKLPVQKRKQKNIKK